MKSLITGIFLLILVLLLFVFYFVLSKFMNKHFEDKKNKGIKILLEVLLYIVGFMITLVISYKGIVQGKFDQAIDSICIKIEGVFQKEIEQVSSNSIGIEWRIGIELVNTPQIPEINTGDGGGDEPDGGEGGTEGDPFDFNYTPNLVGMDETTAINNCVNNGYTYSIEYYLGGNGTVISQSPSSEEGIAQGSNIIINIGISQDEFSNKLLAIINQKRSAQGLGSLSFSDELNYACSILAQENVNSVDCIRPNGLHWSSVIMENSIMFTDGTFTTRSNITSLSDASGRLKYAGNEYGDGHLLTPSYNIIGMAYTSNNSLVIIVGY